MNKGGPVPTPARWRGRLLPIGVALVALAAGYLLTRELRGRSQLQAVREALAGCNPDAARAGLGHCLHLWPEKGEVRFLAARAARRCDALEEASAELDGCRKLGYESEDLTLERRLLEVQQGRLAGNEDGLLRQVLQEHPQAALILEALAKGYARTGRPDQALDCLDRLDEAQPVNARALVLRGQCLAMLDRNEEALASCRQAVKAAPGLVEARLALANALYQVGHVRAAADQYEWLRARHADQPEATVRLALCLQDLAEFGAAERLLDGVLASRPGFVPALVERARVAFRRGQAEAGAGFARQALKVSPFDPDAPLVLSQCLAARGFTEEARTYLQMWRQHDADAATLPRLALRLRHSPRDPELLYRQGVILLRLGRLPEGERCLLKAVEIHSGHARASAALADYYERSGKAELAALHRRGTGP